MNELSGAYRFSQLTRDEQKNFRNAANQMAGFARQHAIPIFFSPPPSAGGKINGGTGSLVQLNSGTFLVTAYHVLQGYNERYQLGEAVQWQAGNLLPFEPKTRIAWESIERDIVLMHLLPEEIQRLSPHCLISTPSQWPPLIPQKEHLVLVAGYPKTLWQINHAENRISAGGYATMFEVASAGENYFMCQVQQEDLVSFNDAPVPAISNDVAGISGGPVFLVTKFYYPLVGIVTQSNETFGCQLLRVSTLDGITL